MLISDQWLHAIFIFSGRKRKNSKKSKKSKRYNQKTVSVRIGYKSFVWVCVLFGYRCMWSYMWLLMYVCVCGRFEEKYIGPKTVPIVQKKSQNWDKFGH